MESRNFKLDFIKGVLIILVVFGHAIQMYIYNGSDNFWNDGLFKFIYMFHMPLFMTISGYLAAEKLKSYAPLSLLYHRFRQIILPMFWWVFVLTFLTVIIKDGLNFQHSGAIYVSYFTGEYWFLWAAFISVVYARAVLYVPVPNYISLPLSALLLISLPIDSESILMTRYTYPFFCVGLICYEYRNSISIRKMPSISIFIIAAICYLKWQPDNYVYVNFLKFSNLSDLLNVAIMFVGSGSMTYLVYILLSLIYEKTSESIIIENVVTAGKYTLEIYIIQTIAFRVISYSQTPTTNTYMLNIIISLLITFFVVAISMAIRMSTRRLGAINLLFWGKAST